MRDDGEIADILDGNGSHAREITSGGARHKRTAGVRDHLSRSFPRKRESSAESPIPRAVWMKLGAGSPPSRGRTGRGRGFLPQFRRAIAKSVSRDSIQARLLRPLSALRLAL